MAIPRIAGVHAMNARRLRLPVAAPGVQVAPAGHPAGQPPRSPHATGPTATATVATPSQRAVCPTVARGTTRAGADRDPRPTDPRGTMYVGTTSATHGGHAYTPHSSSRGHLIQPISVTVLPAAKTTVRIRAAEEVGGGGHGSCRPVIHTTAINSTAAGATTASA